MKKLMTLLLAAGLLLGAATADAKAVELKVGGQWQFLFGWMDSSLLKHDGQDNFYAAQRIRPEFRFVASETLSATLQFEIGQAQFGQDGWGMGADSTDAIKFRYGYVDWIVPHTTAKVRMGMQKMALPQYGPSALVFGGTNDIAGVALSFAPVECLDVNFFWARPVNNNNNAHNEMDVFALALTGKGDGFKVSPFGMVASIGSMADLSDGGSSAGSNRKYLGYGLLPVNGAAYYADRTEGKTAWWAGIGGELTLFDPFKVGIDFAYGSVDFGTIGNIDLKRRGWMVQGVASYKMSHVTPGLAAWYGSGDDDNPNDGSERMPYIFQDVTDLGTLGFDSGFYCNNKYSQTFTGTWGVQARLDDISFIDHLRHSLRFAYWWGTNDKHNVAINGVAGSGVASLNNVSGVNYLTEKDSAWMLNFDSTYQIYKNLTAALQLAYLKLDIDDNVWGDLGNRDDKMYLAALSMTYKF